VQFTLYLISDVRLYDNVMGDLFLETI
jgi:hypothetical protein